MLYGEYSQIGYEGTLVTWVNRVLAVGGVRTGQGVMPFGCELPTGWHVDYRSGQRRNKWIDSAIADQI